MSGICVTKQDHVMKGSMRKKSIYMTDETIDAAGAIGRSNVSLGVRMAVEAYNTIGDDFEVVDDDLLQQPVGCQREAEAVLGVAIREGRLHGNNETVRAGGCYGPESFLIDGSFTRRELEAIVWWLRAGLPVEGDSTDPDYQDSGDVI